MTVQEAARLVGLRVPEDAEMRASLVAGVGAELEELGEAQFFRQNGACRETWKWWVDPAAEFADELPTHR